MAIEKPKFARNKFLREAKDKRRTEAQARQAKYDSLTIGEKIVRAAQGKRSTKVLGKLCREAIEINNISSLGDKFMAEVATLIDALKSDANFARGFFADRPAIKELQAAIDAKRLKKGK